MTGTTIIANGTVLTCDAANRSGHLHIAIDKDRFVALSENLDSLLKEYPGATVVDATNMLIVPGFINAHYHGESFLLRHLTAGMHYALWDGDMHLAQARDRLHHSSGYDDVRRLYRASSVAHLLSGCVCVGEFPPLLDEGGFTHMMHGIRTTPLKSVMTLQNWDQVGWVRSAREKLLHGAVNIGEENDLTVYSLEKVVQAARELKLPIMAHLGERREGLDIIRKNFQKDALSVLRSFNAFRHDTVLVHANYCSEDDVMKVKDAGGTAVVCARSTAAKQTGYPSLRHFAKRHVRIALGTDWGHIDMMDEMRFMNQLPLVVPGLRMFSALEILRMGTINSAVALGITDDHGSIEAGKYADAVMFEMDGLRTPMYPGAAAEALAGAVVNHFTTGDISALLVNGAFVIKEGRLSVEIAQHVTEDFMTTYNRFFPQGVPTRTTEYPHEETKNVIPFSTDPRAIQDEREGFEEGFTIVRRKGTIVEFDDTTPASPIRPTPQRGPVKPELPGNVRRVFGEDDDV